jgi:hypothetical protein
MELLAPIRSECRESRTEKVFTLPKEAFTDLLIIWKDVLKKYSKENL